VTVNLSQNALATHKGRSVLCGWNEKFLNFENATGGAGNDFLTGNRRNNRLVGGPGKDTLVGGGGTDDLVQ